MKTDGKRVFVLAGAKLLAYDVTGDAPKLLGSLTIDGSPQDLLLRGDRVLVLGCRGERWRDRAAARVAAVDGPDADAAALPGPSRRSSPR